MSLGYIPGGLDTSDGLTKAMSSANSVGLLNENSPRIVTEIQKTEIRKRLLPENTILFNQKQFTVGRVWAKTCDERRAREVVRIDKQR